MNVKVPVSRLADGEEGDGIKLSTKLPVAQDNNAWVKFTKNWGDLRGGANYHGSAVSGGYDHKLSDNWQGSYGMRLGVKHAFAKGWFLSGETLLQKGAHDKDISASVQFKRVW